MRLQMFVLALMVGFSFGYNNAFADNTKGVIVTQKVILEVTSPGDSQSHTEIRSVIVGFDLMYADTVGNHTYIELNRKDMNVKWGRVVLNLLNTFENAHPELRVTGWRTEINPDLNGRDTSVRVIWIDHEPRKASNK